MRELTPQGSPLQRAVAKHKAGDLEGAEKLYKKVGRRDPQYPEALRMQGLIAHRQGDNDKAVKLVRRAVQERRTSAVFHHTLAEMLRANHQGDAAIASYRRAWKLMPERNETGKDLAQALAQAGHVDEALTVLRQLLPRASDAAPIYTEIVTLYHKHGYPAAVHEIFAEWRAGMHGSADDWYQLGSAYVGVRRLEEAAACFRKALEQSPDHMAASAGLGSALQLLGELDEACAWFGKVLDAKPNTSWVYPARVAIRDHDLSADQRATLERLADDTSLPESDRMHMQFALGALHDREHNHEQAFRRYDAGNQMHARREVFDPVEFEDRVSRMIRLFDQDFFQQRADYGDCSDKPLFIVGMPRSGTSLVEQIIASHPQAHGAGELEVIPAIGREVRAITGSKKRYPETVAELNKAQTQVLAQRYLTVLNNHNETAARVTDKMPLNLLYLGLIAVLYPQARVVYCRRNAMDNCLSCYFQIFNDGYRYTYDQKYLGHVYNQHQRLMAHWAEHLPLDMLTVDYEDMVGRQEEQTRRLIDFTGLPWDDQCLAFHKTKRDVQTASTWQVRQPMYKTSVERWRPYEQWLAPLMEVLGD